MITRADLENWFEYHAPNPEQVENYRRLRDAAHDFARVVLDATPPCADQSAALRKLRECVATANMAIACERK